MKLQLKRNVKKALVFAIALFFALAGVYAYTQIYWSRSVTMTFDVKGISAELLQCGYENYRNKVVATSLDANGQAVISIYGEQFYSLWLNTTFTSNATGLQMTMTGQYVAYQWVLDGSWQGKVTPIGDPFDISGYHEIDKTLMMWKDPGHEPGGPIGYGLLVTITPIFEYVTISGHYEATVTFAMGFTG
jgi:hypothetical protein